jgi:hypothetical protein
MHTRKHAVAFAAAALTKTALRSHSHPNRIELLLCASRSVNVVEDTETAENQR